MVALDTGFLHLNASIATVLIDMLLDSGASHNFIFLDFVAKIGVPVISAPAVMVRLADGSTLETSGMVTVSVRFSEAVILIMDF